jgi:hypothetical protein
LVSCFGWRGAGQGAGFQGEAKEVSRETEDRAGKFSCQAARVKGAGKAEQVLFPVCVGAKKETRFKRNGNTFVPFLRQKAAVKAVTKVLPEGDWWPP